MRGHEKKDSRSFFAHLITPKRSSATTVRRRSQNLSALSFPAFCSCVSTTFAAAPAGDGDGHDSVAFMTTTEYCVCMLQSVRCRGKHFRSMIHESITSVRCTQAFSVLLSEASWVLSYCLVVRGVQVVVLSHADRCCTLRVHCVCPAAAWAPM